MIEEATGDRSGSVYQDRVMPRGNEGIVIKTHRLDAFKYSGAIHIIRHPLDAIASYFQWKKKIKGVDISWKEHICNSAERWKAHTLHWQQAPYPTTTIKFEDMKANTARELGEVISFLGREATQNEIEKSVEAASLNRARKQVEDQKLASQFYRKGRSGEGKKHFTFDEKKEVLRRTGPVLKHAGYNIDIESTDEMP
jgi:hypothetical protein